MLLEGLKPSDLALPDRFPSWRPAQEEAVEWIIYSEKRFQILGLPTGSGKSLAAMTAAQVTGKRTVVLTSTKGLQDQYSDELGLVDIRGKGNYRCSDFANMKCEEGSRVGCRAWMTTHCPYSDALAVARSSQSVVTNYKYWFHINRAPGSGLCRSVGLENPIELLVCDEGHLAPKELSSYLAVKIYEKDIREILFATPPDNELLDEWSMFADQHLPGLREDQKKRMADLRSKGHHATPQQIEKVKRCESLIDRLERISDMTGENWVCESFPGTKLGKCWEFDPIWPGLYAENALFRQIPQILLMSATVRPKTVNLLGVKQEDCDFREWPRVFPASRSPVYHVPGARMRWNMSAADMEKWVAVIDAIIDTRLDRKGILHTVSYERQDYLFRHSRHRHVMIGNSSDPDSPRASEVVRHFKHAQPPAILVSPSFSTGWDFPGPECEWQIITKIPFPNSTGKIMKVRAEKDKQYLCYLAMQELVQATGRGMRSEYDRCETFVVDDSIEWFFYRNKSLAPSWFTIRKMAKIPAPPIALADDPKYWANGEAFHH